ncbi:MAG TPA: hypothetical protein VFV33_18645 [Gemmatimonadaceae bacterium]|nr:hypothetical protein [Gemmatimonadaceae bacterium]
MSPHVAAKVAAARRALGDLAAALQEVSPDAVARVSVMRAAREWDAAIVTAITAAGQHPLTARCDVQGCRGCPVCAPSRREVSP